MRSIFSRGGTVARIRSCICLPVEGLSGTREFYKIRFDFIGGKAGFIRKKKSLVINMQFDTVVE
jgi:hypothetical protein